MTAMRAKFQISSVEKFGTSEKVNFMAIGKSSAYPADGTDEDNTYARYTPSANCSIMINNPELIDKFTPGQKFYVDFTEAV